MRYQVETFSFFADIIYAHWSHDQTSYVFSKGRENSKLFGNLVDAWSAASGMNVNILEYPFLKVLFLFWKVISTILLIYVISYNTASISFSVLKVRTKLLATVLGYWNTKMETIEKSDGVVDSPIKLVFAGRCAIFYSFLIFFCLFITQANKILWPKCY